MDPHDVFKVMQLPQYSAIFVAVSNPPCIQPPVCARLVQCYSPRTQMRPSTPPPSQISTNYPYEVGSPQVRSPGPVYRSIFAKQAQQYGLNVEPPQINHTSIFSMDGAFQPSFLPQPLSHQDGSSPGSSDETDSSDDSDSEDEKDPSIMSPRSARSPGVRMLSKKARRNRRSTSPKKSKQSPKQKVSYNTGSPTRNRNSRSPTFKKQWRSPTRRSSSRSKSPVRFSPPRLRSRSPSPEDSYEARRVLEKLDIFRKSNSTVRW